MIVAWRQLVKDLYKEYLGLNGFSLVKEIGRRGTDERSTT